jgi:hypothetical protein
MDAVSAAIFNGVRAIHRKKGYLDNYINSFTGVDGHDRHYLMSFLVIGNFAHFCPLLAFDS